MTRYVLDQSAIVAVLRREKGYEKVMPRLYGGLVSSITIADLMTQAALHGAEVKSAFQALKLLHLEVVSFSELHALLVAELSCLPGSAKLGHSELAVLSLAMDRRATVLTSNELLSKAKLPVKINLFRKND
jgi:ribonuclease VapC